jgi:hypothetical protein
MNWYAARGRLTALWILSLVLAFVCVLDLRWRIHIPQRDFLDGVDLIVMLYGPYVGTILAFYFTTPGLVKPTANDIVTPFRLAFIMSILWNAVVLGSLARAWLGLGDIDQANQEMRSLVPKLSWLLAPSLGLFFGKS